MQTLKVMIISAMLAFVIVLMPGHTIAQPAATQPSSVGDVVGRGGAGGDGGCSARLDHVRRRSPVL